MAQLTREEFLERYGDEQVKFAYYYKYVFTFSGKTEAGNNISVSVGGDPDEIYRLEVANSGSDRVRDLNPSCGSVDFDDGECDEFDDY